VAHHLPVVGDMASEIVPAASVHVRAGQNRAGTHSVEDTERETEAGGLKEHHVVAGDAQYRCVDGVEYGLVREVDHYARPAAGEADLAAEAADRLERSTILPLQAVVVPQMAEWAVIVKSAAGLREGWTAPSHWLPLPRCHLVFSSGISDTDMKSNVWRQWLYLVSSALVG
jgi:hypothetical protein